MTQRKTRLTVTVDPALVDAGNRAVTSGAATSLSAWVSEAMADRVTRDARLSLLRAAVADHEAEFGDISDVEIALLRRADRDGAVVVRGGARSA